MHVIQRRGQVELGVGWGLPLSSSSNLKAGTLPRPPPAPRAFRIGARIKKHGSCVWIRRRPYLDLNLFWCFSEVFSTRLGRAIPPCLIVQSNTHFLLSSRLCGMRFTSVAT